MLELFAAAALTTALSAEDCSRLEILPLENASITKAQAMPEGPFQGEMPFGAPAPEVNLPAHCRLTLELRPTDDSLIEAELWLPLENWNGKFLAVGNGGWAGSIQGYPDMIAALQRGYATAASDNGHSEERDGPSGMFALGHPEKVVDFAYRSIHDMTDKSKHIIGHFYRQPADLSYYKGCSTGGRQGLMAAQRYPGDFDGIIAGAPANRHIHMHVAQASEVIKANLQPEYAVPAETAQMVTNTVLEQCDVLGEGFVSNPQQCSVDFSNLLCAAGESSESCLTPEQLQTVETYYNGVRTSDGELVFAGRALSVPFTPLLSNQEPPIPLLFDTIRILGFEDPDYDWRNFDLDRDLPMIDSKASFIDAVNPDLQAFYAQGGKLLMYHGWEDPGITPQNTVDYYASVQEEMGGEQDEWMRLFMVPGMGHCRGGAGPDNFDTLTALETWREQGQAPNEIMARNDESGLERPLCPYPQEAVYDGSGDLNDSSNWSCQ